MFFILCLSGYSQPTGIVVRDGKAGQPDALSDSQRQHGSLGGREVSAEALFRRQSQRGGGLSLHNTRYVYHKFQPTLLLKNVAYWSSRPYSLCVSEGDLKTTLYDYNLDPSFLPSAFLSSVHPYTKKASIFSILSSVFGYFVFVRHDAGFIRTRFLKLLFCSSHKFVKTKFFLALDLDPLLKNYITVNPHWFQCGSGAGLFVNFGKFPLCWIRIRVPNTDPAPGEPN